MLKLNQFNPTAKLLTNLIVLIVTVLIFDPQTMGLLLGATVLFGLLTRSFRKKSLQTCLPLLCFAVAMLWMNAAFAKVSQPHVIARFGPLHFTDKGLIIGLALCFRIMTIGVSSILFVATTEPNDLILSLIQQCRLSPGIAYGVLTAFRFLPAMEADLALINAAHRLRNAKQKKWYLKKNAWYRNAIPLLAVNIRKAERVALAMAARGFENNAPRTYYKTIVWRPHDTALILGTALVVILIVAYSSRQGWLVGFHRWQGF
jgi:energy-coupling factor transport system permease protein